MSPSRRGALLVSLNSFTGAMLALLIACSLQLSQPFWAMVSAYIVSHPLAGAVRSKALYRLLGTALGAAVAVVLVSSLIHAPLLLCLALALWVGGCLSLSLLDRTPRSYLVMLAGYTAVIVAFASVTVPSSVFDIAVARLLEISLGIICATATHSMFLPRPIGTLIRARLNLWVSDAKHWALEVLRSAPHAALPAERRHLAASATEIHLLSVHLPFDTSAHHENAAVVHTLYARMALLVPLLSGISERVSALSPIEDAELLEELEKVARWIEKGAEEQSARPLIARLDEQARHARGEDWQALLRVSLRIRLSELVRALADCQALGAKLDEPGAPLTPELSAAVARAERLPLHRDLPLALCSGAAAALAVLLSSTIWIASGWSDGAFAPIITGVVCCFFATQDDPVPPIAVFGAGTLLAAPVAALYLFAILPAIDSFAMLTLVLAPTLLLAGCFLFDRRRGTAAMAFGLGFCNILALQPSYSADLEHFANVCLGVLVGVLCAILVTGSLRSMSAAASVRRLKASTYRQLAAIASHAQAHDAAALASTLIDRVGLVTMRLAETVAERDSAAAMREVRVGLNLAQLVRLGEQTHGQLKGLFDLLAAHFSRSAPALTAAPSEAVLTGIDGALARLTERPRAEAAEGIAALVGLRRGLFPHAAPYLAPAAGETP